MTPETRHSKTDDPDLMLFVTGDSPRSSRARLNLLKALQAFESRRIEPREIDVTRSPDTALEYGIFASPALVYHKPEGRPGILYGDLSDRESLHGFLADALASTEDSR